MPRSLQLGTAASIGLIFFTVFASLIFLGFSVDADGSMLISHFDFPFYQYWEYWACCIQYPIVGDNLRNSGAVAAFPAAIAAVGTYFQMSRIRGWTLRRDQPTSRLPRRAIRGVTDNHGHARWATLAEMKQLWPGPDPVYGGIVIGEAYDPQRDRGPFDPHNRATWGRGGSAAVLIDPCRQGSTHSLVFAGSGSFKTVSAVSDLLTWTGSAVVLDPAAELGPMLEDARLRMGHAVYVLSPDTAAVTGFNVLEWIAIDSSLAETNVAAVVEWVCGYTPRRDQTAQFFKDQGKALVTALLAHMLWDPEVLPGLKTLRTLRAALSIPETELRKVLKKIHEDSPSRLARDFAGPLCSLVDETFSGIFANANEDTRWLSTKAYADLVSGNSFRASDIADGKTDVFLCLPLKALEATPAVARCIIGALLNAVYDADGAVNGRVLYLLDEAACLGPMRAITVARDAGRKFGITLRLLYQSVGQIEQQWGKEGKRSWQESATSISYAAIKDLETARELSQTLDQHGVLSWSESHRAGLWFGRRQQPPGRSVTYSETGRPLMRAGEIMADLRGDAQIVIPKNGRPVLCGRAIYFRRPEFAARVAANRFAALSGVPINAT